MVRSVVTTGSTPTTMKTATSTDPGSNLTLTKRERNEAKRKSLDRQCWYHGICSRESIEPLLTKKGDFLVRATESDGLAIVLSLYTGERVVHFTISVSPTGRFYLKALRSVRYFRTVFDLVKFYKTHKIRIRTEKGSMSYNLEDGVPKPKWLVRSDTVSYDQNEKLGSGNFADVYKGTFQYTGERGIEKITVAVKVLKARKGRRNEKEAKQTMIREGKVMSFYSHQNVVQFYGVACDLPQQVILVMEYCPGGSLDKHLLRQKSAILPGERLTYCLETALGMRYLHSQGCLHRDLAARNCLISTKGIVKIADFGLCKAEGVTDRCDMKHMPIRWMAPETLIEEPLFSRKSDIWSFGMLCFEVFNEGVKPWLGCEPKKVATNIRRLKMPEVPAGTPAALKNLILTIWSRKPGDRPPFYVIVKKLREMRKEKNLKQPTGVQCAVNRIANVCRPDDFVEDSSDSAISQYTAAEERSTVQSEVTTMTTTESISVPISPKSPTRRRRTHFT